MENCRSSPTRPPGPAGGEVPSLTGRAARVGANPGGTAAPPAAAPGPAVARAVAVWAVAVWAVAVWADGAGGDRRPHDAVPAGSSGRDGGSEQVRHAGRGHRAPGGDKVQAQPAVQDLGLVQCPLGVGGPQGLDAQ